MNEIKRFTNKEFCVELALLADCKYATLEGMDECLLLNPREYGEGFLKGNGSPWTYFDSLPEGRQLANNSIPYYLRDIGTAWELPRLVKTEEQKQRFQHWWDAQGKDVSTPWALMESCKPMNAATMISHAFYYAMTGDQAEVDYCEPF
jgi:hypothetical protein